MKRQLLWTIALMLLATAGIGCSPFPDRPAGTTIGPNGPEEPVETPAKTYAGLGNQTCAIMVWADWRTRTEYNRLQVDLARMLEQKLTPPAPPPTTEKQAKEKKAPAGSTVQYLNPASVVRYQREHPEIEGAPIVDVAPRLGVARVIYIECEEFEVQSPESIMILRGRAKVTLRVMEVAGGKATVVFEEPGISAHYPPDSPEGVVPSDKYTARTIYNGTVEVLARKLAARFEMGTK